MRVIKFFITLVYKAFFVLRGLMFIAPLHNLSQCSQQLPKVAIILPEMRKWSKNEYYESQDHILPKDRAKSLKAESSVLSATSQLTAVVQRLCRLKQLLTFWSLTFPSVKWGRFYHQHHPVVQVTWVATNKLLRPTCGYSKQYYYHLAAS